MILIHIASCLLVGSIISGISHCQIVLNVGIWFNKSIFSPRFHFHMTFDTKIVYIYIIKVGADLTIHRFEHKFKYGEAGKITCFARRLSHESSHTNVHRE